MVNQKREEYNKEMFNISDYLKRTVGIIDKGFLYKKEITAVIQKHTGIIKEKDFFEIKDGVMRTTLSPGEKGIIFIKKESILADLASFGVKEMR